MFGISTILSVFVYIISRGNIKIYQLAPRKLQINYLQFILDQYLVYKNIWRLLHDN